MHLVAYKLWKNCHYFESYGILKPPEVLLRKEKKKSIFKRSRLIILNSQHFSLELDLTSKRNWEARTYVYMDPKKTYAC